MIRTITPFFVLTCLVFSASAQPTLDGSSAPAPGYTYDFVVAPYLNLSGVGANQVWDASGAVTSGADNAVMLDLASSTAGNTFPMADVVVLSGGTESYIDVQADGLYIIGSYIGNLLITSTYTDPYRYLIYPCQLGDAWNDTYDGSYMYNAVTYAQAGSGTFEATGYGTLVLPWGSISNVLRVDGTEIYSETGGGNFYEYIGTFSYFYKPGLRYFLAKSTDASATLNGSPAGDQLVFTYMTENSVGLDEQEASSIGMEVFPNPADRTANVIFTADRALSMEVYDVDGRLCMQRALNGAGAGLFRESIDVSGLPAGMYSVIVHGRNGQRGVTRMIVAH